ncbi:hypothetical protein LAZ67_1007780 [Cordylochernes scorpioides]|uniref:Ig-like domain-containing protein n=1 Tax=Cordylochernes scorpioides TaxID=51811 RepID=A0ABY6JZR8_9ARAC|nr:hypothetical protein LAZ67_1007780 [Cordylochernes scorpioides]
MTPDSCKGPTPPTSARNIQVQPFVFPSTIKLGDKITVTCSALKGQPPFTISWLKDGTLLTAKSSANIRMTHNDINSNLYFDPVEATSGGNYTCQMKNKHGQDSYTAALNIQAPPEWTAVPQDATALEGNSVTLSCHARGSPTPRISWSRLDREEIQNSNSSTLVLNPVGRSNVGKYRCTADNGLGPPLQHTVTLTVHCEYGCKTPSCNVKLLPQR